MVTGYGTIDGRDVCVFSQDATVFGGSLGEVYGEKIVKVQELAIKTGRPIIGINDGAGARIQEGVVSLGLYGEIFRRNIMASGVVPQISLIMGAAAGGHVYSPALTDFVVMVDQTSQMFITGPDVIKTVTGEDVTMEELGGGHTHMAKSGLAHYVASGEQDAFDYVRDLLSYLPPNNYADPPRYPVPVPEGAIEDNLTDEDLELDTLIPDSPNQPYDMHERSPASSTRTSSSRCRPDTRPASSSASAASRVGPSESSPTSRRISPAAWISTPQLSLRLNLFRRFS